MKIKIKENCFTPIEWCVMVTEISEGYFTDGQYTPHYGRLNEMRVFFNSCVDEWNDEKAEEVDDLDGLNNFVNDKDFLKEYENKRWEFEFSNELSFHTACETAMDIVEQRIHSWGELTNIVSDSIQKMTDYMKNLVSEDNIKLLQELSKSLSDGEITADDIVEAYGKTIGKKE